MTGRVFAAGGRPLVPALVLAATLQAVAVAAVAAQGAGALRSAPLAGLRAEVAALIVQGVEGGSLPLAVSAPVERATVDDGGLLTLALSFEVPGAALLGGAQGAGAPAPPPTAGELELELYVYAIDAAGAVAGHRAQRLTLALAAVGERLFDTGLRYRDAIRLPAGAYSLRFLALDPARRVFGLAVREVTLGPRPGPPVLAPPRFAGGCENWVEAGSAAAADAAQSAARPVLRAGRPVGATVELAAATAPSPGADSVRVVFEPRPGATSAAAPPPAADLAVPATAVGAGLEIEVTPPADLPQGRYLLWVETRGGGGGVRTSSAAEVWVLGADAALAADGCLPTWGEVYRLALGRELVTVAPMAVDDAAVPAERGARERRFRRRYLELLAELPDGRSLASARVGLGEIEAEFLSQRLDTFPRLRAVELAVARELTASDRRCLPILLALHEEAYEEHFGASRYGLATHSRELVVRLIEELVADSADEDEARLAAVVLTTLSDRAERHQVSGAAQEMLERALELDPDNQQARFLLATSYERVGRVAAARRHLERLVAASAGHDEGRLRLAVLLAREGRWADSERLLGRLVGEGLEGWQRVVVYETLGRLLLSRERFEEAVELLRRARAEMPEEQRLTLLGAYALDRAGRPSAAATWLAELPAAAAGGSARLRYGRPPTAADGAGDGGLRPLRELVARSLAVRLPILARALDGIEEAGG